MRPERVNKWPNSMKDWWWWEKTKDICTNWKERGVSFDKCGQGDTCDFGLLCESIWALYSPSFDFSMQNLEKLAHWKHFARNIRNCPWHWMDDGWGIFAMAEAFFIVYKNSKEDRALLTVDRLWSLKNVNVLSFEKENDIVMCPPPPQCTHQLQPLNVSFYDTSKTYYNQEVSKWLKASLGRTVKQC